MTYTVLRSKRKSLALIIKNGKLVVKSPLRLSDKKIREFIDFKRNWITKHLSISKQKISLVFDKNSEYYWYQGQKYKVYKKLGKNKKYSFELSQTSNPVKAFFLTTPILEFTKIDKQLLKFEKQNLAQRVELLWSKAVQKYPELGEFEIVFRFRRLKSRWGSCSTKGVITLNTKLIHLAPKFLEAVFWHEISHLYIPNHSSQFYSQLASFYPDYKSVEQDLKNWSLS